MDTVTFVVRVKNEEQDIEEALQCLRAQKLSDYKLEIILVDSESTDETVLRAKPYADKILTIRQSEFTWGKALNLGIAASNGNMIGLISGHCMMKKTDCLQNAINIMKERNVVCLYGRQLGDPRKDPFECVDLRKLYPEADYLEAPAEKIPYSNACCLFRRESWEHLHFDELLQSAEDVDWASHQLAAGNRLGYSNRLTVLHGHPLNVDYFYRKTFWKVYRDQIRLGRHKGFKSSLFYLALSNYCILPLLCAHHYYTAFRSQKDANVSRTRCLMYAFICYAAHFDAKYQYFHRDITNKKYEDIRMPGWLLRLGSKFLET